MEPLTRAWRYLLAEPFTWVVCCFFRPTRFQKDIEIPGYFKLRRTVPMLRTSVPLLVCFFPLFCGVVVIDLRVNSLEVDIPTLSSISFWLFLGCTILSIFGGIILGIARGVTLAVVWNIVYMFAVLYTSLDIGVDTFLAMMLGFGI